MKKQLFFVEGAYFFSWLTLANICSIINPRKTCEVIMLPEKFEERMKALLGEEYERLKEALELPAVKGFRANTVKISAEDFSELYGRELEKIPYVGEGFIPLSAEGVGRTPEHHSGMIYVQDPGAMATLSAVKIQKGALVLDTCAAPGGKASQLAAMVGDGGFVFANEYVAKRAKITVGNFERLGIRNAIITSLDTAEFPKMFEGVFDLVLCDAPCSGEGMFRKYTEALEEWSEENVLTCAERQKEILDNCAGAVKAGGYLLYSTCTYSPEENEMRVAEFLDSHPDFELAEVEDGLKKYTSDGIRAYSEKYDLSLARRFYPHISKGEGQFIALMKRSENALVSSTFLYKSQEKAPSKDELSVVKKFFSENMTHIPEGRLIKQGEGISILPSHYPLPERSVFMAGVMAGEVRKGLFTPHHQLFSAYGLDFKRKENLKKGDPRIEKYLRGEEIEAIECKESGYVAVLYEGVALGGGKASGGRIKNHYPKGIRNK